jgi:hypothetical protein
VLLVTPHLLRSESAGSRSPTLQSLIGGITNNCYILPTKCMSVFRNIFAINNINWFVIMMETKCFFVWEPIFIGI